jgi:hypothetical protein
MAPPHCSLHSAKHEVRAVYRQTPLLTKRDARRIAKRTRCLERSDRSDLHRFRNRMRAWRRAHRWQIEWRRLSAYDRNWANAIAWCESRRRRYAANASGHLSYFQWALSTWYAAGGHGHPFGASYHEQAVRAVRWRNKAGASQWSCKA